jgi:hypothetical protein
MTPSTCRRLLAAALLLPGAALAQPETEGRLDAVSGAQQGDRPIAEVFWQEDLQGLYAIDGACDEADVVWAFARDTVGMGRTVCTSLGKMTYEDDWLHVPASQCTRMGTSVDSPWLALREEEGGEVLARLDQSEDIIRLVRCPHPTE